ncbi:putative transcriptional regulator/transcriptional regulator with XRE-family HTH domain [Agromyces terreus]|uniref:Transcriptional regulator/transcriptional regulator with XRE-family HTH domain n=1 Tax=Agromyces terreus TaxID=424795 RepID=A0A9X2GZB3_9MICO|nr:helix-turn-helix transcriptional regulator [Agromyces terreus]MCP2369860.1 putative transcriptional regulator/transcriptional regulator with XRE-family HTH domain [Agromyces terreus]
MITADRSIRASAFDPPARTASAAVEADVEPGTEVDALTLGRRIREHRTARSMTLGELAAAIDRAPSQVSAIENGKREPRLSMLRTIALALGTSVDELLKPDAPSERAALEIAVERAQRGPVFSALGLEPFRVAKGMTDQTLATILALHNEIDRLHRERAATPEEARRANALLRAEMRARDNFYPELEAKAAELLEAVGHTGGPVSHQLVADMASHLGYSLHYVGDLPHSTRSVTDKRNGRIYLPTAQSPSRDSRSPILQALASHLLGHEEPGGYAEFLRQRIETNYLTAAILLPEQAAVRFLTEAKNLRRISMEDLRDAFAVSYETAAHRFTNLATARLGIPVHFTKVHESGTIIKAYENDRVRFPSDALGAIEGTTMCRNWTARTVFDVEDRFSPWYQYTDTPSGTFWCTSRIEKAKEGEYSVSVGVPFEHVKWFRGRETPHRAVSRCPDPACCQAPSGLAERWADASWPAARTPTSLLAALPTGTFPGVDQTEVFTFLEAHAPRG